MRLSIANTSSSNGSSSGASSSGASSSASSSGASSRRASIVAASMVLAISGSLGCSEESVSSRPSALRPDMPDEGTVFRFAPEDVIERFDEERVRIHYTRDGSNAVPAADEDGSGIPDFVELAGDATETALAEMKRFLDERGSTFIVLGIDNAFTVDRDVFDEWVAKRPDPASFRAEEPLDRLGRVLAKHGIRYVNVLPEFRKLGAQIQKKVYNGPPTNLSGHLEPEAEDTLSKLVVPEIVAALQARAAAGKQ